MTAFDTELGPYSKCPFSAFFPAAFGVYTTFLVLAIMIIVRFPLFPPTSLLVQLCVVIKSAKAVGQN